MGAALKKFWNRIIEFTNPSVDLGQPKYPSAEVAVSSLEERYRNILAQLNKSEDEMIAYIESRSVFNTYCALWQKKSSRVLTLKASQYALISPNKSLGILKPTFSSVTSGFTITIGITFTPK